MPFETNGSLTTATKRADGMAIEIQTDATVPTDTSINLTVKQDESGGTTADTTQTISVPDGTTTTSLSGFANATGSSWWLTIALSTTNDTVTPTFNSATLTVLALSPPSNVAITDDSVEGELTIDWDEANNANGYFVYRAEVTFSSTSDATQVADVTTPPYTDTGLEDGEKFYYRVTSYK